MRTDKAIRALVRNALAADRLGHADAAAIVDRSRPHVTVMLTEGGARALTAADVLLLCVESESLREAVIDWLVALRGEP